MKPEIQTLKPMTVGTCACGAVADRHFQRGVSPGVWTAPVPMCGACFERVMTVPGELPALVQPLLEDWLRMCAGHRELLANYDRLRGTNLSGRGTPIDRLIDEATGKLEAEAQAFFDWCVEMFERLDWKELI